MLTNKLINATGVPVKMHYDKGVYIRLEADGVMDLTMEQMDDFRPGKPGSEEVRLQLNYHGLFLMDGDKSYDEQALEAVSQSLREKRSQFEGFVGRMRDSRIAQGSPIDDETMAELINRAGYSRLEGEIEGLKARVKLLQEAVTEAGPQRRQRTSLDPTRTCYVTEPPREFPSSTALKMFLSEQTEDFVARHEELATAMRGEE
jgi:hypothetical protein